MNPELQSTWHVHFLCERFWVFSHDLDRASRYPRIVTGWVMRIVRASSISHTVGTYDKYMRRYLYIDSQYSAQNESLSIFAIYMIRYRQAGVASINLLAPSASTPQDIQDVGRYVDVGGVAYAGYEVSEDQTTYVVIRPDGMIGAYATSVAQVHRFFSLIMSEGVSM